MARHAAVDVAQVLRIDVPRTDASARCSTAVVVWSSRVTTRRRVAALYEPYGGALSDALVMPLPGWRPPADAEPDDGAASGS